MAVILMGGCASPQSTSSTASRSAPVADSPPEPVPVAVTPLPAKRPDPRAQPAPARANPARPAPEVFSEPEPRSPEPDAAPATPAVQPPLAGSYVVQVESEPGGATVVVDGVPVGRTPCAITLAGTDGGFFRNTVSVRVRFIADDPAFASATVEEAFALTDRIPAKIVFTPTGAKRIL